MAPQVLPGDENAAPENREPTSMQVMKAVYPAADAIESVRKPRKRSASELEEPTKQQVVEPVTEATEPPSKRARLSTRLHGLGAGCLRRASALRVVTVRQTQKARGLVPTGVPWRGAVPFVRSLCSRARPLHPVSAGEEAQEAVTLVDGPATERVSATVATVAVDQPTTALAGLHSNEVRGGDAQTDCGVKEDAYTNGGADTDMYTALGAEVLEVEGQMEAEEAEAAEEDVALVVDAGPAVDEEEMIVYAVDDDYDGDLEFEVAPEEELIVGCDLEG
mmetsp:Transcript_43614/g.100578  ORF Transcript_43614/g.100578 Transcript_43614/m.100578 type:complete len:277 (+) Transcript_43614:74-904(+)